MDNDKNEIEGAAVAEKPAETLGQFILGRLKDMTLKELKEVQEAIRLEVKGRSEEAKVAAKEAKEAAKEAGEALSDQLVPGATVTFSYKGGTKTAKVFKVTDKTFHVDARVYDLDYKEGGKQYRYIPFGLLLSVVAPEPAATAAA